MTVVGVPGRVVVRNGEKERVRDLRTENLPDPLVGALNDICTSLDSMEKRISALEEKINKEK